ncbi:MAG: hypothetical protein US83_C0016G0012 [Candidatus Falkowbacteria bacterium GW2011_GWC2_38_22]|uniref:Uncharacterized protein n=1 Tax=Candidatus Falkowbacteria bacterium GW2011_GWE1_38_31 TaxID=1618638 RepID=A0A0G0JPX0_9BACT|nr:MAG: hypothetical protein US73_C0014G0012 [Candidatus Falkowbacteria bacterium GW2011_GWF2_38_1205]KKQ60540.1 MAG: hypothetical protein US83_C0016G0012 [Candidatus Falkowbacteria bacterium GW2011_GWC2_38_22]KKQ62659.1 MAG: hypothetical protein US84_C0013G0012 [Candidatus Falkowbacteria bacterium GW2011_GWF1_38_22]KKQ64719.1 MAG: hypothetical protein US87_C0013G0012 [Candidatus Falkowbacteria bacterium GW2011_GWE2_38_254]KKQ69598.1 MAG: hypothetical protein US91_C0012G0012 [Candidatus Falkowb
MGMLLCSVPVNRKRVKTKIIKAKKGPDTCVLAEDQSPR